MIVNGKEPVFILGHSAKSVTQCDTYFWLDLWSGPAVNFGVTPKGGQIWTEQNRHREEVDRVRVLLGRGNNPSFLLFRIVCCEWPPAAAALWSCILTINQVASTNLYLLHGVSVDRIVWQLPYLSTCLGHFGECQDLAVLVICSLFLVLNRSDVVYFLWVLNPERAAIYKERIRG